VLLKEAVSSLAVVISGAGMRRACVDQVSGRVVIGVDPHKAWGTIEVLDRLEQVVLTGRFGACATGCPGLVTGGSTGARNAFVGGTSCW
jgi:hypothetical protein